MDRITASMAQEEAERQRQERDELDDREMDAIQEYFFGDGE